MGPQAFDAQLCAKAETRGLEMAFLAKILQAIVLLFLNYFRANQVGFKQVFDNLTVKHIDALRKKIQSLADYVLNHCFGLTQCQGTFENDRKK